MQDHLYGNYCGNIALEDCVFDNRICYIHGVFFSWLFFTCFCGLITMLKIRFLFHWLRNSHYLCPLIENNNCCGNSSFLYMLLEWIQFGLFTWLIDYVAVYSVISRPWKQCLWKKRAYCSFLLQELLESSKPLTAFRSFDSPRREVVHAPTRSKSVLSAFFVKQKTPKRRAGPVSWMLKPQEANYLCPPAFIFFTSIELAIHFSSARRQSLLSVVTKN